MNAISDEEGTYYPTDDEFTDNEFFTRNLRNTLTGGIAVLGFSLRHISRLDNRINTVCITKTCDGCIERATFPDDNLSVVRRRFIEALEFNSSDIEESATQIGENIAMLPSVTVLELRGCNGLLENWYFHRMFGEISSSETIKKIVFRNCEFTRDMYDNISMIINSIYLKEVEFWNCSIDTHLVEALREEEDVKWERMYFDKCKFDDGVHAALTRLHAQDISSLINLEYNNCSGIDDNWQRLLQDGDVWRYAVSSYTNTDDQNETSQLLLQRSAIVRTDRERRG